MSASSQSTVDLDALLDLTEYDSNYHSPSLSPNTTSKAAFASPIPSSATTTPSLSSTSQTLTGPSHNYDLYRQQTGFVPGALANTMAVNQSNNTGYQDFGSLDYVSTFTPEDDLFDFNTSPSQSHLGMSEMELDFDSSLVATQQFFPTINPSAIEHNSSQSTSSMSSQPPMGRLWPGAHSQAALAKAQAQRKQQQLSQQQSQRQVLSEKVIRNELQPTETMVQQKITQVLNSMRAKPSQAESDDQDSISNATRMKKEEDDMDEDERLLASEEGKKLSSKERRQLRNKVSARAFRSRRKEYISQLEGEIAGKVNENGDLRSQNRSLLEENKRLTDLTRMLLSSPSFSNFLDHLSTNTSVAPQSLPKVESLAQPQPEQRQIPKDVNPSSTQQSQQQQIGMAMIPEQSVDFSMLSLDNNAFNFQPQVFVVDTSDIPTPIDSSILSGKVSVSADESFDSEKLEIPALERQSETVNASQPNLACSEDFDLDAEFPLFEPQAKSTNLATQDEGHGLMESATYTIFGGVESEKIFARYELVDATEQEIGAAAAMARIQRISERIEPITSRLELLTIDL